jgi:hypothetical protein
VTIIVEVSDGIVAIADVEAVGVDATTVDDVDVILVEPVVEREL